MPRPSQLRESLSMEVVQSVAVGMEAVRVLQARMVANGIIPEGTKINGFVVDGLQSRFGYKNRIDEDVPQTLHPLVLGESKGIVLADNHLFGKRDASLNLADNCLSVNWDDPAWVRAHPEVEAVGTRYYDKFPIMGEWVTLNGMVMMIRRTPRGDKPVDSFWVQFNDLTELNQWFMQGIQMVGNQFVNIFIQDLTEAAGRPDGFVPRLVPRSEIVYQVPLTITPEETGALHALIQRIYFNGRFSSVFIPLEGLIRSEIGESDDETTNLAADIARVGAALTLLTKTPARELGVDNKDRMEAIQGLAQLQTRLDKVSRQLLKEADILDTANKLVEVFMERNKDKLDLKQLREWTKENT